MEHRPLGRTGVQVSTLAVGTGSLTTDDAGGRRDAAAKVDAALEAGVTLFDTADAYAEGRSEQLLGGALQGRRDDVLVATKVRYPTYPGPNGEGLTRRHLVRSVEASLTRLGTDRIDLYQLHAWDGATPLEETFAALADLVRAGKVLAVGVSNFSGWHLAKAVRCAAESGVGVLASQQVHYTPYTRDIEYELLPAAVDAGVGTLVWSPLAGGLLTGRYDRSRRAELEAWTEPPVPDPDLLMDVVDVVRAVADELGCTAAQAVLAWTRDRPGITSVVVGGRTVEQLRANLAAAQVRLEPEQAARIAAVARPRLLYPYWHQRSVASRLSPADRVLLGEHLEE